MSRNETCAPWCRLAPGFIVRHVLGLGGRLVLDRSDDEDEPLYVFADPAGHPFCVFVG